MLFAFLILLSSSSPFIASTAIEHVVIFGIDGLAIPPLLELLQTSKQLPSFERIISEGAYTFQARSVQPAISYPNWYSIFTATDPAFHGIHTNEYQPSRPQVMPISGACTPMPTLFTVLRSHRPRCTMGAFYEWNTIGDMLNMRPDLNVSQWFPTDDGSVDAAVTFLKQHRPLVTLVYLDDVDETGHRVGFGEAYTEAILQADQRIGHVWQTLDDLNMLDRTLIAFVTDHGRKEPLGKYHGSFTQTEMNTFWALWGPGIRRGHELKTPVANYDVSPSLLHAMGLPMPLQWRGRPVREAFENQIVSVGMLPDPELAKDPNHYAGWLFEDATWNQTATYQQCMASFQLQTEWLWGQWDNASFGVGVTVGVLAQTGVTLFIWGLCCLCRRRRPRYAHVLKSNDLE